MLKKRSYFIDGRTIPRRITFWQRRNTTAVGIETNTNPAITHQGWPLKCWLIWYIHTAKVQCDSFWHTRNAHSHELYAAINELSALTARIGVVIGRVIFLNTSHSPAPSIEAASYNSRGNASKNPLRMKIDIPLAIVGKTSAAKVFRIALYRLKTERSNCIYKKRGCPIKAASKI